MADFLREILVYPCDCGWREIVPPQDAVVAEFMDLGTLLPVGEPVREKMCPRCGTWVEGRKESWKGPDFPNIRGQRRW